MAYQSHEMGGNQYLSAFPTADYQLEAGATRNYEPWRDKEKATIEAKMSREDEERGNAMKASQAAAC